MGASLFGKAIAVLDKLADLSGKCVAPLTVLMMVLTFAVVLARYLFKVGAIPVQETVMYLHGIVFMVGIAYTLKTDAHVRVDIFYHRLGNKGQAIVNLLGTLLFLFPMAGFILWSSLDYVAFSWQLKEASAEPRGLPFVYLLKTLIPIMAGLLILQGVGELLKNIQVIRK